MDEESGEFGVQKKSSAPLIILVVVAVAALGGGAFFLMGDKDPEVSGTGTNNAETVTAKKPTKTVDQRAKEALDEANAEIAKAPGDFENNWFIMRALDKNYGSHLKRNGVDTVELIVGVEKKWEEFVKQTVSEKVARCNELLEVPKYDEAYDLVRDIPAQCTAYFANFQNPYENEILGKQTETKKALAGQARLTELRMKALKFLHQEKRDIGLLILREFEHEKEQYGPAILAEYERNVSTFEKDANALVKKAAQERYDAWYAEKLRKEEEERQRRRARWKQDLKEKPWWGHLNAKSLYNWVVRHGEWKLENSGGVPTLKGVHTDSSMRLAFFANHWEDFAFEFEMKLDKGSLDFSPRSNVRVGWGASFETRESITFSVEDDAEDEQKVKKGEWVRVTMEVQESHLKVWLDRRAESSEPWLTINTDDDDFSMLTNGGPAFMLNEGGEVQLRNIRSKLINHNRPRDY